MAPSRIGAPFERQNVGRCHTRVATCRIAKRSSSRWEAQVAAASLCRVHAPLATACCASSTGALRPFLVDPVSYQAARALPVCRHVRRSCPRWAAVLHTNGLAEPRAHHHDRACPNSPAELLQLLVTVSSLLTRAGKICPYMDNTTCIDHVCCAWCSPHLPLARSKRHWPLPPARLVALQSSRQLTPLTTTLPAGAATNTPRPAGAASSPTPPPSGRTAPTMTLKGDVDPPETKISAFAPPSSLRPQRTSRLLLTQPPSTAGTPSAARFLRPLGPLAPAPRSTPLSSRSTKTKTATLFHTKPRRQARQRDPAVVHIICPSGLLGVEGRSRKVCI